MFPAHYILLNLGEKHQKPSSKAQNFPLNYHRFIGIFVLEGTMMMKQRSFKWGPIFGPRKETRGDQMYGTVIFEGIFP